MTDCKTVLHSNLQHKIFSARTPDLAAMLWTLVFLVFSARKVDPLSSAPSSNPGTCPRLQDNFKAAFHGTKDTYEPGETLSYSCNVGFRLTAKRSELRCEKTGKWKPRNAICQKIKCKKFTIANGRVKISQLKFNTKVNISCSDGYQLRGPSVVSCGENSTWIPALPTCQAICPAPPYIPNANTEHNNQTHYDFDTVLRYKCNHGYRMVQGPSTIHCKDGRWTDLQMRCEKKKCGSAGEIENGRYVYTGASFGDTVTVRCSEGYLLVGVGVRHCRAHGWDGGAPVCEAIQCPEPPLVAGAALDFDTSGLIKVGYMASYRCHHGNLIGESYIICTEDGTWSAPPPRCEVAICLDPNVLSGIIISGRRPQYQSGNSVRFRCSPGWRLLGPDVITCGSDGHWSPRLPHCVN